MICQRCAKDVSGIHTCTPSDLVRELHDTIAQQAELLAAHKSEVQDWQRELLTARQERYELQSRYEWVAALFERR